MRIFGGKKQNKLWWLVATQKPPLSPESIMLKHYIFQILIPYIKQVNAETMEQPQHYTVYILLNSSTAALNIIHKYTVKVVNCFDMVKHEDIVLFNCYNMWCHSALSRSDQWSTVGLGKEIIMFVRTVYNCCILHSLAVGAGLVRGISHSELMIISRLTTLQRAHVKLNILNFSCSLSCKFLGTVLIEVMLGILHHALKIILQVHLFKNAWGLVEN